MEYRKLGNSGPIVSAVSLGTMQFGRGMRMGNLDQASNPGVPSHQWMVLQLDQAEDPRPHVLDPERFVDGGPWQDLRGRVWKSSG